MSERRRRVFTEAFKREAVERVATSGLPIVRVAEELGVHETVLRRHVAEGVAQADRGEFVEDYDADAVIARAKARA